MLIRGLAVCPTAPTTLNPSVISEKASDSPVTPTLSHEGAHHGDGGDSRGLTTYLSLNVYKLRKHERPVESQLHDVVVIKLSREWLEEKRAARTAAPEGHPISTAPTLFSSFLPCSQDLQQLGLDQYETRTFPLRPVNSSWLSSPREEVRITQTHQCVWDSGRTALACPLPLLFPLPDTFKVQTRVKMPLGGV